MSHIYVQMYAKYMYPDMNKCIVSCICEYIYKSQVTFIYIALLTIQIVSKQLHNIKIGK